MTRTTRTAKKGSLAKWSDAVRARALVAFRKYGTVVAACKAAGIGRQTWYDWVESDHGFAKAVQDASEEVLDELEEEALRRAKDGSDVLLIFLLKCLRRAKYQDRARIEGAFTPQQAISFAKVYEGWLYANLAKELADRAVTEIQATLKAEGL